MRPLDLAVTIVHITVCTTPGARLGARLKGYFLGKSDIPA